MNEESFKNMVMGGKRKFIPPNGFSHIVRGYCFHWRGDAAKVMAVADGYAMARKKGCLPFVISLKEIHLQT